MLVLITIDGSGYTRGNRRVAIDDHRAADRNIDDDGVSRHLHCDRQNLLHTQRSRDDLVRQIAIDRGTLLIERDHAQAAQALALSLTRAEPQNVRAWTLLAYAARTNLPVERYALDRALKLEPRIPGS